MPAFSHCFLKRFIAFSNDSPSLTRTPGILRITTFWPEGLDRRGGTRAKAGQYMRRQGTVKPLPDKGRSAQWRRGVVRSPWRAEARHDLDRRALLVRLCT